MSAEDGLKVLQQWAKEKRLSDAKLSLDGKSLEEGVVTLDASQEYQVSHQSKSCQYTLASLFLQILDPNQGLMSYRSSCKTHNVTDPVKALDKPIVVGFFLGGSSSAVSEEGQERDDKKRDYKEDEQRLKKKSRIDEEHKKHHRHRDKQHDHHHKRRNKQDRHHHHHHRDDRHRDKRHRSSSREGESSSASAHREKKKRKAPMTNEQLFSNLNVVVGKRSQSGGGIDNDDNDELLLHQQEKALQAALSAEGFMISPQVLEKHKEAADQILAMEIPVGNSASILRASEGRDFSRVLDLYLETVKKASAKSSSSDPRKQQQQQQQHQQQKSKQHSDKSYLIGKRPVIVLPKGMTSPITMVNAHEFFASSKFVPRDVQLKKVIGRGGNSSSGQQQKAIFSRRVGARLGGGMVEYELMDNPKAKLGTDSKEWERVVAVITLGASWQFKDWPTRKYSDPVSLFNRTFGFYIGMEGDPIPSELTGWNVKKGKLNRDKRGLDSVTHASFWNGLDEWMSVHKRELLPRDEK